MANERAETDAALCRWCKDPLNPGASTCRQCQKIQNPILGKLKSWSVVEILGVFASIAAAFIAVVQAMEASTTLDEVEKIKSDISVTENRIEALTKTSLDIAVSRLNSRAQRISEICTTMRNVEIEGRELKDVELPSMRQCNADIRDLMYEVKRNIDLTTTMSKHALTPDDTEHYIKSSCDELNRIGYRHQTKNNLIVRKSSEEIILQMFGSDITGCFERYPAQRTASTTVATPPKVELNFLPSQKANSKPVFRFYSDKYKSHFYTLSEGERDTILSSDQFINEWIYEGQNNYAYDTKLPETVPVHRYYNTSSRQHFYTSSVSEQQKIMNRDLFPGWLYEGIAFYVPNEVK